MKSSHILTAFVSFSSLSWAWPWPESNGDIKPYHGIEKMLYGRQDDPSSSSVASSAAETGSASASESASDSASSTLSVKSSGSVSASTSKASGSASGSGSKSGSDASKTTAFDPRLPAGGVEMVTPAAISGPQYYKIGDYVTFAWNYTSLSVTPSAIDILASCSKNQATYTLATNQSVEGTGMVVWDTKGYQATASIPLLTETYTLIIYDAASSISATPKAGYLGVFNQWTFGMYTPQAYTPLKQFECATCLRSGALSAAERQTLIALLSMVGVTILSFTWFATGRFSVL